MHKAAYEMGHEAQVPEGKAYQIWTPTGNLCRKNSELWNIQPKSNPKVQPAVKPTATYSKCKVLLWNHQTPPGLTDASPNLSVVT